jgi:nitrogen fixation protein NifX
MRRLRLVDTQPPGHVPAVIGIGKTMKVAFATQDLKTVDAHFAGARHFAVYDVTPDGHRLVEAIGFDTTSGEDGVHADANDDRITPRVEALDGCALLFVLAIGGPAAARVVAHKIHPVKVPHPEPIPDVLDRVQTMLKGSPPPWLRKAIGQHGGDRPAFSPDFEDA